MKITLIVEGQTEKVFIPYLRNFLRNKLAGNMPSLDPLPCTGRIYTGDKLQRTVNALLNHKKHPSDHVIALTDVYTGTREFTSAADAKSKMRSWVGDEPRFHPHAAQYDFEAWLLPYWKTIQLLAGHNQSAPKGAPETVNHDKPPAHRIQDMFERSQFRRSYVKTRDAMRILKGQDLGVAISQCSELQAFVNTILTVCGGKTI